ADDSPASSTVVTNVGRSGAGAVYLVPHPATSAVASGGQVDERQGRGRADSSAIGVTENAAGRRLGVAQQGERRWMGH
ncbi:MAG TPA: hypothetical protein VNA20_06640, partial [Frankiaceae bacterium]|nr:hypothetical protein [Frankiaceae bacterium]